MKVFRTILGQHSKTLVGVGFLVQLNPDNRNLRIIAKYIISRDNHVMK